MRINFKNIGVGLMAPIAFILHGCGDKLPGCGDDDILKIAKESIIEKNIAIDDPELKDFLKKNFTISLDNPIVVSEDENLGKRQCKISVSYRLTKDQIDHIATANSSQNIADAVGFRWRLMTGAMGLVEYGLLERAKMNAENSRDNELVKLIDNRAEWLKAQLGGDGNSAGAFAMLNPKFQSDFEKDVNEQRRNFLGYLAEAEKGGGQIKFNARYLIEKTANKSGRPLIKTEWDKSIAEGIVYGIVWELAFQGYQKFSKIGK